MADPNFTPGKKEELDRAMGRAPAAPKAAPATEPTPEHKLGAAMTEHLKTLLGITHTPVMGEMNPANAETLRAAGVSNALDKGIADGTE